jgi:hypothetical protein
VQIDYIVPRRAGGGDGRSNLQGLCLPCHDAKSRRDAAPRLTEDKHKRFTYRNGVLTALERAHRRCHALDPDGRPWGKRAVAVYGPAISSSDGLTLEEARMTGTLEELELCLRRGQTLVVTCKEHGLPLVEPLWTRRRGIRRASRGSRQGGVTRGGPPRPAYAAGMATYALVNWTARKTDGSFPAQEAALEAKAEFVGPDDEWSIWEMS